MADVDFKFTRIQNEILEAFGRTRIPGEARQILDIILRKTYGFQKKMDSISLSQFAVASGLKRQTVHRALKKLISMNLVIKKDDNCYGLQKNFDLWKPSSKKITVSSKVIIPVIKKDDKLSSKKITTKDNKDTYTKDNIYIRHFKEIWSKYPNKDGRKQAERHFRTSVKTEKDWQDINKALENYLSSQRVKNGYIKNGSTWFNNWKDWIDYIDPQEERRRKKEEQKQKELEESEKLIERRKQNAK